MIKERNLLALAVVAVLAACGGGGGGGGSVPATVPGGSTVAVATTPPAVTVTASPAAGQAVAQFTITLAKGTFAQSVARRTQTVGTGTESIVFTLLQQNGVAVNGAPPQAFGLTASSPGCAVNATTGNLGCTLQIDAPIGTDVFLAQTYSNSNGTGSLTGSGAVALSVGINSSNTASIVLNAQVASVVLVAENFYLGTYSYESVARRNAAGTRRPLQVDSPFPTVTSTSIFVVALDSSGNVILNPSAYSSPVYVQLAFDPTYTADVTLTATYAANDPSPCTPGGTATASDWWQSFPICSPSDTIVATESANGGADPSYDAYVFGWVSTSQLIPTPAPSATPAPFPSSPPTTDSYLYLYVFPVSTPTPTATGNLPIVGQ